MINGWELGGRSEGEAYVARMCNLNAQYCRVFDESKACVNLITGSFSFSSHLGSNPGILNHEIPLEKKNKKCNSNQR